MTTAKRIANLGKKHIPPSLERDIQTKDFIERVRINQQKLTAELKPHYDFIVCGVDIPRRDADPIYPKLESRQVVGYEGPRRKILIVDDEPLNRLMLKELLSTAGFDTADASSPKEAFS